VWRMSHSLHIKDSLQHIIIWTLYLSVHLIMCCRLSLTCEHFMSTKMTVLIRTVCVCLSHSPLASSLLWKGGHMGLTVWEAIIGEEGLRTRLSFSQQAASQWRMWQAYTHCTYQYSHFGRHKVSGNAKAMLSLDYDKQKLQHLSRILCIECVIGWINIVITLYMACIK
jgi:hypothetical protein